MATFNEDRLLSRFNGNAPAQSGDIRGFEEASQFELPKEYALFLRQANGGEGFIGKNAYVIFWRLEELLELNQAYQVSEYAPGLFMFGSDGGGEAYAFDARTPARPIVSVPFVGMELSLARPIASDFKAFLEELFKS